VSDQLVTTPPEAPEEPKAPTVPLWGKLTIVVSALLVAIVLAGFLIHVPYTTISPGSAEPLAGLVSVEGAKTFPKPRGDIRLLDDNEFWANVWLRAHQPVGATAPVRGHSVRAAVTTPR